MTAFGSSPCSGNGPPSAACTPTASTRAATGRSSRVLRNSRAYCAAVDKAAVLSRMAEPYRRATQILRSTGRKSCVHLPFIIRVCDRVVTTGERADAPPDMHDAVDRLRADYAATPYLSDPFPQPAPGQLAAIAPLFGLATPDVATARVLEIGCAAGGN